MIESSKLDEKEFALKVIDNGKLQKLHLYKIDWTGENGLYSTDLLNKILNLYDSSLTGKIHIYGNVKSYEIENYYNKWNDLAVTYDNIIQYYLVRYLNWDGSLLYSEYIQ